MIWNRDAETMDIAARRELQARRLRETVARVYENVPFYRAKMEAIGITPGDIRGLEDLPQLPFTTKQDMRDNYPYGMLAVPLKEIVRIHSSSGTTGRPTVVAYTKNDLGVWAEVLARALAAAGVNEESVFQVAVNYGLFTGGLGFNYAAELVGASVIPASSGNTARQVMLLQDFKVTSMIVTPSYALHLAEIMAEQGVRREDLSLKSVLCGAESWSDGMRREIEAKFGVKTFDVYGLSEIIGPGVSSDCELQQLHIQEDHFCAEIIDPETGEVLPEGARGELVLTTLTKQGMPMIRYRTRDLTSIHRAGCACGRTTATMSRVLGRSDDMLIIRGVNIFPSQVETVLLNLGETAPHYQLIVDRVNNLDTLTVVAELSEEIWTAGADCRRALARRIQDNLRAVLGLTAAVELVEPRTIKRSEGKAVRVIDKRRLA